MRVVLITGKGGVGKTTIAAATAIRTPVYPPGPTDTATRAIWRG